MTPFTADEFFGVFTAYNVAVWPAQAVLLVGSLAGVHAAIQRPRWAGVLVPLLLAGLWLWMGAVYHLGFFTAINPAAYAFGGIFIAQGVLFAWAGLRGRLSFSAGRDVYGILGAGFVSYALIIYPALGALGGHAYPAAPTFGAPCPTTIFTFGLLLWADRRLPVKLLLIPLGWSLIGGSALWMFGVLEDAALPLAGILGTLMIMRRNGRLQLYPATSAIQPGMRL
jgi:hypothetical protein